MPIPSPAAEAVTQQWESGDELITIGDWSMTVVDEYGVDWLFETLDGWFNGYTTPDPGVTPRAADTGGWAGDAWAGPRIVHIGGRIKAPTWDDATLALARMQSQIPISGLATMAIYTGGGAVPSMQAQVRQAADTQIGLRVGGYAKFSIAVIAPDPRRYGVDEHTVSTGLPVTTGGLSLPLSLPLSIGATVASGRVTVVNDGNTDTPPVLEVAGPCPPCSITHLTSGRTLKVPETIPAGRTLIIDTDRRTALLDGVAERVVTGTWWRLDAGSQEIGFNASSYDAGAQLTIRYRHAWR